jgi:hypothetical protein
MMAVAAIPIAMVAATIRIAAGAAIVAEAAGQSGDRGAQQDEGAAVGKQSTHYISPFTGR